MVGKQIGQTENRKNIFVSFSGYNKKYGAECVTYCKSLNTVYMSKRNADKLVNLLNDGVVKF